MPIGALPFATQQFVEVKGSHFIQEDSPHEIGAGIAAIVCRLRGGAA